MSVEQILSSIKKRHGPWMWGVAILQLLESLFFVGVLLMLALCLQQLAWHHLALSSLVILGLLWGGRALLGVCFNQLLANYKLKLAQDLFDTVWRGFIHHHSLLMRLKWDVGDVASRLTDSIQPITEYISRYRLQVIQSMVVPAIILVIVASLNWWCALILAISYPMMIFLMVVTGRHTQEKTKHQLNALARLNGVLLDFLQGMSTLKSLNVTRFGRDHLQTTAKQHQYQTIDVLKVAFLSSTVIDFFTMATLAVIATTLGFGLLKMLSLGQIHGPINLFQALFILLLVPNFFAPIRQWAALYHIKHQAKAAGEQIEAWLQSQQPANTPKHSDPYDLISIEAKNLGIGFEGDCIVSGIDFELKTGQMLWINGPSGIGKSTLLHTILGLHQPQQGQLIINQKPFSDFAQNRWFQSISWLGQDTSILEDSIRQNLQAVSHSILTDQMIHDSLAKVSLAEPDILKRLDQPLTEFGQGLSGGQRQRLALAKAIIKNGSLWLLDEPLAHLDGPTANQIVHQIKRLSQNQLVIVVSHHDSWQQVADFCLTLDYPGQSQLMAMQSLSNSSEVITS